MEIEVDGIGHLSPQMQHGAIGVRVRYGLSLPWLTTKPSNPLPRPPSLIVNHQYQLGQDDNSFLYLGDGWSHRESWGVWMNGNMATMNFSIPRGREEGLQVRFKGQGFVVQEYQPEVVVDVLLNRIKLGEMRFTSGNAKSFEFSVPESAIDTNGEVHLTFVPKSARSPMEIGMSNDPRQLSFGLVGFGLHCDHCVSRQER